MSSSRLQEAAVCFSAISGEQGLLHPSVPFQVTNRSEAHLELNAFRRKHDCALVISGDSLEVGAGTPPAGSSRECAPLPASLAGWGGGGRDLG